MAGRNNPADAYTLYYATVRGSVVHAAVLATGKESAFAPAIVARGSTVTVAWMEGDAAKRGRIRMGRLATSVVASPGTIEVVEREDVTPMGNHRDPELAVAGDRLYLAWADFTLPAGQYGSGIPTLRTMTCR